MYPNLWTDWHRLGNLLQLTSCVHLLQLFITVRAHRFLILHNITTEREKQVRCSLWWITSFREGSCRCRLIFIVCRNSENNFQGGGKCILTNYNTMTRFGKWCRCMWFVVNIINNKKLRCIPFKCGSVVGFSTLLKAQYGSAQDGYTAPVVTWWLSLHGSHSGLTAVVDRS